VDINERQKQTIKVQSNKTSGPAETNNSAGWICRLLPPSTTMQASHGRRMAYDTAHMQRDAVLRSLQAEVDFLLVPFATHTQVYDELTHVFREALRIGFLMASQPAQPTQCGWSMSRTRSQWSSIIQIFKADHVCRVPEELRRLCHCRALLDYIIKALPTPPTQWAVLFVTFSS